MNKLGLFNKVDPAVVFAMEHQTHRRRDLEDPDTTEENINRETLTDRFIRASKEFPDTVTPSDVLSLGIDIVFAGSETT